MHRTPGLHTGQGMVYPNWYGLGDHRVFILEILAQTLFGGDYQEVAHPTLQLLSCKISHIQKQYCKTPKTLVDRHCMVDKLHNVGILSATITVEHYQKLHHNRDHKFGDFVLAAKKKCQ